MKQFRLILLAFALGNPWAAFNQKLNQVCEVAVFIGLDCPISQKYIAKVNDIYRTHRDQPSLEWHFIVPGPIAKKRIKNFQKEYGVTFPIEPDNNKLRKTKHFNATVTPEVVILRDGKILYKGAIDNWFYELGSYRSQPTEHYLVDAIESILKNQEPSIKETEAIGCFIQKHHKRLR